MTDIKRYLQIALTILAILIAFVLVSPVFGEKAHYFYDSLGRLARTVTDTGDGAVYLYDEVGNLISITREETSPVPPVLASVDPGDVFSGTTVTLTIKGDNLLTTEGVSAADPGITVYGFSIVDDGTISANITVSPSVPSGQTSIDVTTLYGSSSIGLYVHEVVADPGAAYLGEGETVSITAELASPVTWDMVVPVFNLVPGVVSNPSYITIPAEGSAAIPVEALAVGTDSISIGGAVVHVFVTPAFAGDASIVSGGVTVRMTAIPSGSLINSHPVNVRIERIRGGGYASGPVSVQMTGIPGGMKISRAVSVQMTGIPEAMAVSHPVSVQMTGAPGGTVISRQVSATINN